MSLIKDLMAGKHQTGRLLGVQVHTRQYYLLTTGEHERWDELRAIFVMHGPGTWSEFYLCLYPTDLEPKNIYFSNRDYVTAVKSKVITTIYNHTQKFKSQIFLLQILLQPQVR